MSRVEYTVLNFHLPGILTPDISIKDRLKIKCIFTTAEETPHWCPEERWSLLWRDGRGLRLELCTCTYMKYSIPNPAVFISIFICVHMIYIIIVIADCCNFYRNIVLSSEYFDKTVDGKAMGSF